MEPGPGPANAARMYDYLLGGTRNFAVDRERAEDLLAGHPEMAYVARANREFLHRVLAWCLTQGIDQFLDLGSGIPTRGNTHEIALRTNPAARVAYVDFDPVAVAHATEILDDLDGPLVTISHAGIDHPESVLDAPGVGSLFDFTRPIAVLALAVLHFVPGDLTDVVARYVTRLAPGSVIAVSHASDDHPDTALAAGIRTARDIYHHTNTPLSLRNKAQISALLDNLELIPPGLVDIVHWPTHTPEATPALLYGGIGRIPTTRQPVRAVAPRPVLRDEPDQRGH